MGWYSTVFLIIPTYNFPTARAVSPTGATNANIFGTRVGQVPIPSPFSDLSSVYPNLSQTNAQVSSDVLSRLKGQLSPETINAIQDNAARFGVQSGMPGSGLQRNLTLRDLGLQTEALQQQGLQDYASIVPTISQTQTLRPESQFEFNLQNAVNRAAPDPGAAATYAQGLFDKYLQSLRSPAGGTGEQSPFGWGTPSWVTQIRKPHYGLGGELELGPTSWQYS